MKLEGILPALTTPFSDGAVSTSALRRNLERYERLELSGYLVLGSTGESVLLDEDERREVLEAARDSIPDGKTMVAGVSAESTGEALRQARTAADCGADALLVSTPHYFRAQMTTEALVAHFSGVADGSRLPVLLYNVPKFTGLVLPEEVVLRMSEHENVTGMKESSGDLEYMTRILDGAEAGFRMLCGDPSILRDALKAGAAGAILASATVLPEPLIRIAHEREIPENLLQETSRASALVASRHGVPGIKAAMDARGLYGGPVRGPLLAVSTEVELEIERIVARLISLKLIPGREL
jgi:4-hydroxy-2-oxoglutarate aldolase